jgi:hypothetical protein
MAILEGYDTYSFSNKYPEQPDTYSFFEQVSRTSGYALFSNKYPEYRYEYKNGCGLEIFKQISIASC